MSRGLRTALILASLLVLVGAAASLVAHLHSSIAVTHITGLLLMLAELLREGVFYPRQATPELVYSTYYQPLAFAPLALLPGSGLGMVVQCCREQLGFAGGRSFARAARWTSIPDLR